MEELKQAVKFAEVQVQQQRTQQWLQEELIAIRKEQLEILKTNKGNSHFFLRLKELQIQFFSPSIAQKKE